MIRNDVLVRVPWLVGIATIVGACSVGSPSGSVANTPPAGPASAVPSPSHKTSPPPALTFDAFVVAACSAFDSMDQAIGNPDAGTGSKLSDELDEAVGAKDGPAATRLAAAILTKLAEGRRQAEVAAGYPSAKPMMSQLDRVFDAFAVMVAAKRDAATGEPGAVEPQTAFEEAGGVDAWRAMLEALREIDRPTGAPTHQCPTVAVSL